jgi:uncharacterized membrane protein
MTLLVVLLVVWLIAAVVGFAIKGLFWLAVIAIILFVGTSVVGGVRRSAINKKQ